MYYPYLRARQFELISLRELVIEKEIQDVIFPVLEPVKEELNNLNIAHKVFQESDLFSYIIVNPNIGERPGDDFYYLNYLSQINNSNFIPAFHYRSNLEFINYSIIKFEIEKCLIIGYEGFNDDNDFRSICDLKAVTDIMVFEPQKFRSLDKFIKGLGKKIIRLDDLFEKKPNNATFLGIEAHKFSEEHLYYKNDNYYGFSDFTVLPSLFVDGGSTPRAVVIHLTYIDHNKDSEIWIRHFTSNTNDSIANVQGKFFEAATKALDFCDSLKLSNSAIEELRQYAREGKYPGLGTVKKISIKNHLIVVAEFLKKS